MEWLIV